MHDALLIATPIDRIEAAITVTRMAMAEASRIVLGGFEVRTEAKVARSPNASPMRVAPACGASSPNRLMKPGRERQACKWHEVTAKAAAAAERLRDLAEVERRLGLGRKWRERRDAQPL